MGLLDYDLQLAKEAIKRFPGLLSEYAGTVNKNLRDKFASDEFDQKRALRGLDYSGNEHIERFAAIYA